VGHVAHIGKDNVYRNFYQRNLETDYLKDLSVEGSIILKWIFENRMRMWT
jgi:hypothetical protein